MSYDILFEGSGGMLEAKQVLPPWVGREDNGDHDGGHEG
jgi:hypothetical protein